MRVVLMSDTHVKSRAAVLPEWVKATLQDADHVIHAGDFDSRPAYEEIATLAGELTAVAGNMDRALGLPEVATVELGEVRFVVTHGTGPDDGYRKRVVDVVKDNAVESRPTIGVSGHTHRVLDEVVDDYRLLNPGSATGAFPAQEATLMDAEVDGGDCSVELRRE